jgi:hypothetical protein
MEGPGSGSVPRTNGSGSRRPKNIRIRNIVIELKLELLDCQPTLPRDPAGVPASSHLPGLHLRIPHPHDLHQVVLLRRQLGRSFQVTGTTLDLKLFDMVPGQNPPVRFNSNGSDKDSTLMLRIFSKHFPKIFPNVIMRLRLMTKILYIF